MSGRLLWNFKSRLVSHLIATTLRDEIKVTQVSAVSIRNYAKSKDKGGGKNKKPGKVHVNVSQLSSVVDVEALKSEMQASLERLKSDYAKHVSLRTAAGSVESLKVNFDGKEYELQELAQVVRKNPKTIVLNMSTFPQAIPNVLESLRTSGMNVNAQQEGTTLYLPVPKVTKEHREHLARNAKVIYLKCRDTIKEVQLECFKKMKKQENLSEDLAYDARKQITAITDDFVSQAKTINNAKHEELLK